MHDRPEASNPTAHVVIGAGPAGAAITLLLARAGVAVTLLEREPDFARVFRGEALMPTGLDALAEMGLRARLDALPWRWDARLVQRSWLRQQRELRFGVTDVRLRVAGRPTARST